jgi:uncharacterized RDD family membrane protein YckC
MPDNDYVDNMVELEAIYERDAATARPDSDAPRKPKPKRGSDALAARGARFGGYLIDYIALGMASFVLQLGSSFVWYRTESEAFQAGMMLAIVVFQFIYQVVIPARTGGSTPGKLLVGTRIVRKDGSPVGYGRLFLRNMIGYTISNILYLGFLWVLIDENNRGWHDYIADTIVVER